MHKANTVVRLLNLAVLTIYEEKLFTAEGKLHTFP